MADHVKRRQISESVEGSLRRHGQTVVNHLMETGEKAFRERQYDLANAYVTVALSLQPVNLDILMRRVLILEKLAMYKEAYDEAQHMINLAPNDARGYLRAGRVLLAQDKASDAYSLFQASMNKVHSTDSRYQLLEVYRKRCSPQTKTFVSRLPYEVSRSIFRMLPLASLVQCTRVSKAWRHFTIHCPDLWRVIDLRDYPSRKRLPRNALAQCINRAFDPHATKSNGVRELWVGNKMTMYDVVDLLVAKDCKHLNVLYMSDSDLTNRIWTRMMIKNVCTNIAHLFLSHTDISIVDVMISAASLPNLTQLVLDGCSFGYAFSKNIKRFDLSGAENIAPSQYLTSTLPVIPFPKLQILGLSSIHDMSIFALVWLLCRCPTLTMLRTMHTGLTLTRIMVAVARYCPLLTYLEYSPVRSYPPIAFEPNQLPLMANMRTLRIHTEQDDDVLHTIFSQCYETLQQLSTTLNDENLLYLAQLGPIRLESLEIPISPGVTEDGLCTLLKVAPNLTLLDVSYNVDAVTDRVMDLLSTMKRLKTLRMFNCVQVSDKALLECARNSTSLRTFGIYQCQFTRSTIYTFVADVLSEGIIECPQDYIVKRKRHPRSSDQEMELNTLVDSICSTMQLDMEMEEAQQQQDQEQSQESTNLLEEEEDRNNNNNTMMVESTTVAIDETKSLDSSSNVLIKQCSSSVVEDDSPSLPWELEHILRNDDLWSIYI
ncbi:uncharacterized protein BX664DRAFT_322783 [Halteromyces radiatus]|uniref:uncharacterized protein n=1 Tax=Halteromyces radiatus TaxID=101107 RepID=UPI002220C3D2|nr:uncharacterized protein BX664DRAFT_322783 [Halteromyces radiatus]KAI8100065.1 hypothetical protein BX664DRAFT_322783 [Halteromyces radiatus]